MTARWTPAQLAAHKSGAKPKKAKAQIAGLTGAEAIEARRKAEILIGIDPGTHTGIAIKEGFALQTVDTLTIFSAINRVIAYKKSSDAHEWKMFVRIEDARQRTWFGKKKQKDVYGNEVWIDTDRERLKGAGSVERDCAIWQEVLTELKIPFEFVHPKHVKATTPEQFERLTGWKGRTSIHAREAAWLII